MTGRRREDGAKPWELEPGDYCMRGRDGEGAGGFLWVMLPNGSGPSRLEGWDVTEHEDGTITAAPSILDNGTGWHGYLTRGEWTTV